MDQSRADRPQNRSDDLSERMNALGEDVKATVAETAGPLKEKAQQFAKEQKSAGADHVAELSRAVHGAADELGKELPQAASYIHSAADRLAGASTTLRERSIEDLVTSFSKFARAQPAAAFAGSVLAGFALSRFLKSSNESSEPR